MDNIPNGAGGALPSHGSSPGDEARLFEDIIRAHPDLPEGVHRVDDLKPSKAKVQAINRFGDEFITICWTLPRIWRPENAKSRARRACGARYRQPTTLCFIS